MSDDILRNNTSLVNVIPRELCVDIFQMFCMAILSHWRKNHVIYSLLRNPDYNVPQPFDWTNDVYSIHFTHPDPPAYANESALQNSTGMFADIGSRAIVVMIVW
jgi:hypothetical protein